MKKSLTILLIGLTASFGLFIVTIISLSWVFSFDDILQWQRSLHTQYDSTFVFTKIQFKLSRICAVFLISGIFAAIWYTYRFKKNLYSVFYDLSTYILDEINASYHALVSLKKKNRILLFALFLLSIVLRVFQFSYLHIHHDELATYFVFVDQGPLAITVYYPFPNNHVFFNYFFMIFNWFIHDPIVAGRLFSFITFHLLLLLLFLGLFRYLKNLTIPFASIYICIFFLPSSVYATEARGYMLFAFFTLVATFAFFEAINSKTIPPWIVFITACILGAFTIPVFAVVFLGFIIFGISRTIADKDVRLLRQLLLASFMIGSGVLFCYLPLILFSGWKALFANSFVSSINRTGFYQHIFPIQAVDIVGYIVSLPAKSWLLIVVCILSTLFFRRIMNRHWLYWLFLSLCMYIAVLIYAGVKEIYFMPRNITYLSYFFYPSLIILLVLWLDRLRIKFLSQIVFLFIIITVPVRGYFQYKKNVYVEHLLHNEYYDTVAKYFNETINANKTLLLKVNDQNNYLKSYVRYLELYHHMKLTNDLDKADLVMVKGPSSDSLFYRSHGFRFKKKANRRLENPIFIYERLY